MKTNVSVFNFSGGIHPAYNKELSAEAPIRPIALPRILTVPMAQHIGAPAKPVVKHGDLVKRCQLLGEADGRVSASVHAPAAGKVVGISQTVTAAGVACAAVVIETLASDEAEQFLPIADWRKADRAVLLGRVSGAGIVGMGGAGFPTQVKLTPPAEQPVDTLILNGAECEPYLTADHRMMLEHAEAIRTGAEIARAILGAKTLRVAIEDNKPEAIAAMEKAFAGVAGDAEIVVLKTAYPQGAEKQQIFSVTGREVPRGGLPRDVGCVMENVSTAYAIYDAVVRGLPLTHRTITVSGDAAESPSNLWVPNGTAYADLVAACGGAKGQAVKVVSGGPMMGFAVNALNVPTCKTTSGVLLLSEARVTAFTSQACIACGRCLDACPMRLVPSELSQCIEADDIESARSIGLMDCIECGSCAYVCPARRPLVHHFRRGKAVIARHRAEAGSKR